MIYTRSKYRGDADKLYLHFIGDLHAGHNSYNEKVVKQRINEIVRYNAEGYPNRVLLMGDLLESATKTSVGAGLFETDKTPNEQMEYIVELLRPIKNYIDGCIMGNHEYRIYKDTSIDVMKLIARELDIPYMMYTGVINYAWNKQAYTVNIWHGAGGGATVGNALNKCVKMANKVECDIYAMGHVHKLGHHSKVVKHVDTRNNKLVDRHQMFVLTGSALDYDESYPDMKNLDPSRLGFPILKLSGKQKKVTYYE